MAVERGIRLKSSWVMSCGMLCLVELVHTSTGYGVGSKSSENPTAKIGVRCSPSPQSPAASLGERVVTAEHRQKTTLSNQNHWEQRTIPSGSFWESQSLSWHCWGGLCTHPSPRIPGPFLIITVNGILQRLSGIGFPSRNAQSGGSTAPTEA